MHANVYVNDHRQPEITVTVCDRDRLQRLLGANAASWTWSAVRFLTQELMRAQVVNEQDVSGEVVTMRSRVAFRVDDSEVEQVATLAYPGDRELCDDALSVLTPVGASLLGLSVGQSLAFTGPDGRPRTVTVMKRLPPTESVVPGILTGSQAMQSWPR